MKASRYEKYFRIKYLYDDGVIDTVDILSTFADDTKVGKTISSDEDWKLLQAALDELCEVGDAVQC